MDEQNPTTPTEGEETTPTEETTTEGESAM